MILESLFPSCSLAFKSSNVILDLIDEAKVFYRVAIKFV